MEKKANYWFKRRRYGYGWVPTTWQGGALLLVYVIVLTAFSFAFLDAPAESINREIAFYLLFVAISTSCFLMITIKKSPKPKWRWGVSKDDNPEEDF